MFFLCTMFISGCGTINNALVEKTKTVEYYRIFDIKTDAGRQNVADAASDGLGENVNDAQEARPIPSFSEAPETPGRFKLKNPFEGTKMSPFASQCGGSLGFKMAICDGAIWSAKASREVAGSDNLNLTACLFQYKEGYHLDLYATFTKQEGGVMELSRSMAQAMVGTPEQWTEKTFLDIVRNIREKTGAKIFFLEGYPKIQGTPWLDTGEKIATK